MSNERIIPLKGRTVERSRGCWNCVSFDNSEAVKLNYQLRPDVTSRLTRIGTPGEMDAAAFNRELGKLVSQGLTRQAAAEQLIQAHQQNQQLSYFDRLIESGHAGLCRGNGVDSNDNPVDFVHIQYLCHKWNGRVGSSVATSGKPLDKLPDELRDDAETEASKRSSMITDRKDSGGTDE